MNHASILVHYDYSNPVVSRLACGISDNPGDSKRVMTTRHGVCNDRIECAKNVQFSSVNRGCVTNDEKVGLHGDLGGCPNAKGEAQPPAK